MKIGFDGKRAVQNFTGLGNYSRYVIEALCAHSNGNEYMLYTPKPRKNERLEPLLKRFSECLSLHYPQKHLWKKLNSLWRIWGIPADLRNDGVELFHGLSNELPLNIKRPASQVSSRCTTSYSCACPTATAPSTVSSITTNFAKPARTPTTLLR